MQELFIRLMNALKSGGPSSAEVQQVLQQISAQFPAQAEVARSIVNGWPVSPLTAPQPASPDSGFSFTSWKFIVPLLATLGIGTTAGTQANSASMDQLWKSITAIPLPSVTNRWELMAIVAGIGAVVGIGYSFYRNNWTLVLPTFSRNQDQFQIAKWGFLRNMVMAAVVSVVTTWLAFFGASESAKTDNLLSWSVIASAIGAGVVGSRMASGEVESKVLREALATSTENPALAGLGKLVSDAKTNLDAAAIAKGQAVPGLKPPKEMSLVRQPAEIEAELLALFDRPTLKALLVSRGKPLGKDTAGLTLEPLDQLQSMKPGLKDPLKNLVLPDVAGMTSDQFMAEVDKKGIDAARFKDLLVGVQAQAVRVKELLASLPTDWTLSADRV